MTEEKKEKKKEVGFNFDVGKILMETIEVDGYEPFQITFKVPGGAAGVGIGLDMSEDKKEKNKDDDMARRGVAVVKYIAMHLTAWSLPQEPNLQTLYAIQDASILLAIFDVIFEASKSEQKEKVKN